MPPETTDDTTTETTDEETPQTTESPTETTEDTDTTEIPEGDDGGDEEGRSGPAREAAKYRRRLRDVEAERDDLAGQLDTLRRQVAERMVAEVPGARLGDPADLWVAGIDVADLLGEDGTVSATAVADAVAGVLEAHPNWATTAPTIDLGQGARGTTIGRSVSWADVLDPSRR